MAIHLAEDLALPIDAVTETFAVLAKRGAGKSYLSMVLVEEMVDAGLPVCVLDPVGVFWGLRSSADGDKPGLPVVIFGGDRGDLPLPASGGAAIADIIMRERIPVVLDLSRLSKTARRNFVADFMERLYDENREPLHLVVDEADMFAPQRVLADGYRLLGAYEDIVRRGRARGLGCTSITQRPASLHTDIRSQSEVLIAMRLTGTHDVKAVDEWVKLHAENASEVDQVRGSLPSLPVGTAWVWSPGWLGLLQRIKVRRRRTFDSSATPKVGETRVQPRQFADVDLDRLRQLLEAVTPEAEPAGGQAVAALRRRLSQLEAELAAARSEVRTVEVPVLAPADVERLGSIVEALNGAVRPVADALAKVTAPAPAAAPRPRAAPGPTAAAPTPSAKPVEPSAVAAGLKAGARRIVEVAARSYPLRLSEAQLATLAGLKKSGGTWGTYWSEVRRRGLVEVGPDRLAIATAEGLALAGLPAGGVPMTADEVRDQWRSVLKAGARTMLDALLDAHPAGLSRAELASAAGLEASGGTFGTYLSTLRRNNLVVERDGQVVAADVFFLARAREGIAA